MGNAENTVAKLSVQVPKNQAALFHIAMQKTSCRSIMAGSEKQESACYAEDVPGRSARHLNGLQRLLNSW